MNDRVFPIFVTTCVILDQKTTFYKTDKIIELDIPGKLIRQLIKVSDGTRSLDDVVGQLSAEWEEASVKELMAVLCKHGVVVDRHNISASTWKAVQNPSQFPSLISEDEVRVLVQRAKARHSERHGHSPHRASQFSVGKLLRNRRSVREFSGEAVGLQSIIDLVWSAYGEIRSTENNDLEPAYRRTVPSAGALYPLTLHIVLFNKAGSLLPGVYRVFMSAPDSVGFDLVTEDISRIERAYVDPLMLEGAHGVIVISGSFEVTQEKYGNRSLLYVTLEAGHAAQNIHIAASDLDVATVEVGGFVDEVVATALKAPKGYRVLTTVVFGVAGERAQGGLSTENLEIDWAVPVAEGYQLPFAMAFARMHANGDGDWSCGRAVAPKLAYAKATSEAREWAACGCVSTEITFARLRELKTAIDPRKIIKFHRSQYRLKGFPFRPFDERQEYAWVEGTNELTGNKTHILADCVYYPYSPQSPRYAHASSSGVAAHPEKSQAIRNGVLELIERDSFMIAYLTQLLFPTVIQKTLPATIQSRIYELEKIGFQLWVKDYSIDLAPVVFIFAQNASLSFTTCAACCDFNIERSLDHALMEVESSVLCRLANGPADAITPSQVRLPSDHGRLYEHPQYFRMADFLIHSDRLVKFEKLGDRMATSWPELLQRIVAKEWQLVTIPLQLAPNLGGNGGLHIIRSLIPGLVPISFGYREVSAGSERVRSIANDLGGVPIPYSDMPKFPHPFT